MVVLADVKTLIHDLFEDLQIVGRDLENFGAKLPSAAVIRSIHAPILRKWVADNGIGPIYKELGKQHDFKIYDYAVEIRNCLDGQLRCWLGLMNIEGLDVTFGILADPQNPTVSLATELNEVGCSFKEFKEQRVGFAEQRFVTREQCVRFVADRMGGTHTQAQAKPRKNDPVDFLGFGGLFVDKKGNREILGKDEYVPRFNSKAIGEEVYSSLHLLVLDTAHRFHQSVMSDAELFDT